MELAVTQKTIDKLKVMETPVGFYVIVLLKWVDGKEWYLTTRRNRNAPRVFKDLNRLNDYLRSVYPTNGFELVRNQELPVLPPRSSSKTKK